MHFNLPDQLALEVAGYDQTRKKLAAVMAAEDRKAKRRIHIPTAGLRTLSHLTSSTTELGTKLLTKSI